MDGLVVAKSTKWRELINRWMDGWMDGCMDGWVICG